MAIRNVADKIGLVSKRVLILECKKGKQKFGYHLYYFEVDMQVWDLE